MTQNSRHWIAAFRSSHRRLADLVTPLSPEQLRAPSACTEWTIASVLSHLGSQTEILSLYFEAALAHSELPSHDVFQPIWDAWNARQPETQAVDCLAVNDVFAARLEGLSDAALDDFHLAFAGSDLDAVGFVRLRLAEHALHSWDIAVALDPAAEIPDDVTELLLDTMPEWVGRLGKVIDRPIKVHVQTSGPDRDFMVTSGEGVEMVSADPGEDGAARLRVPAAVFLRLLNGRLRDRDASHMGLTGDVRVDELRRMFPGF